MNKIILVLIILAAVVVGLVYWQYEARPNSDVVPPPTGAEKACRDSGGVVALTDCYCSGVSDFPNMCMIGVCSCNPIGGVKTQIKTCDCGQDGCFNGERCSTFAEEIQKNN